MLYRSAAKLDREGTPFVVVTVVATVGSAPQEAGAKMLVTVTGLAAGTVGGGKIEAKAINLAQELLSEPGAAPRLTEWNLQTDVGMTCGGKMTLFFEPQRYWRIAIFGAGHVSQMLVRTLLLNARCRLLCIDPRRDWIEKLPASPSLKTITADSWESLPGYVGELGDSDFVLAMTRGHAADRPILEEIFRRRRAFPYLGVIGSAAKRKIICRELIAAGIPAEAQQFRCPIGIRGADDKPIGGNSPAEIALSIAAELLAVRDGTRSGA